MIFGWDISTSIIGLTTFDDDCKFVSSEYLDLRKVDEGMIIKSFLAESWIRVISDRHTGNSVHYVEDKLGGFSGGKTMQQTLLKLAGFNATVSYLVWKSFNQTGRDAVVEHIHPSTVKAILKKEGLFIPKGSDKKKLTLEFVSAKEPNFKVDLNKNGNFQPWCFDKADSYIVARAGFLRKKSSNATGKKSPITETDV